MLKGSFTLVLSEKKLNSLDEIAKQAWAKITSHQLRTVTQMSPANKTIVLPMCPSGVVQKKYGGVYVILNVENGKAVIGQTTEFKNRFNQYAARASRSNPVEGDSINKAYYKDAQAVKARTGNANLAFQRFIVYAWLKEDITSRQIRNEMLYLEHRLMLAFFECGLAYNTNDSAPQLNDFVTLDRPSESEVSNT